MLRLCSSLTLVALLAVTGRAGVHVVDGDVDVLQAAVDAAADGDILLIKPGGDVFTFSNTVSVDGKSLTLVVDGGTYALSRLIVRNIPAGGQVTVRGLLLGPLQYPAFFGGSVASLEVEQCAGSVWIDACTISAPQQSGVTLGSSPPGMHGVAVFSSSDVVISDCAITGAHGINEFGSCTIGGYLPSSEGGDGLLVSDGRVVVHGSTLTGGVGGGQGGGMCPQGSKSAGGHGLHLVGESTVHGGGCALKGADNPGTALQPGSGLVIEGPGHVSLRDSTFAAGSGAPAQQDIIAPLGSLNPFGAPARALRITSPLRVGQSGQLDIAGQPADLVAVFESPAAGYLDLPGKQGVFLLGSPLIGPVLALVLPADSFTLPFDTPPLLPPGVDGTTVLLQLFAKAGPNVTVEDVATCTLLDASIP